MLNLCQELEKDHCRQRRTANGTVDCLTGTSTEDVSLNDFDQTLHMVETAKQRLLSASSQTIEKAELIAHHAWETLPSRALDKVEDIARLIWNRVPELSLEKAEEIARRTLERLPIHQAEAIAHRAWEAMPEHPLDKVEEIAQHVWESVPELSLEKAEEIARNAWDTVRKRALDKAEAFASCARNLKHFHHLPQWMRDNDFLLKGHRPPLNSFWECFKSIFSIHSETGNIWTHLLGCIAFVIETIVFLTNPSNQLNGQDKLVFVAFFLGAILCLGFSSMFHTVYCHSEKVGRLFSKLDYCGISFLIVGSFVPWLYYSFYCHAEVKLTYLAIVCMLGAICIFVSMWDGFSEPRFRTLRAGVFAALGLTGVVPAIHYVISDGISHAINYGSLDWLVLVGLLYLFGAVMYAVRFPERMWPGKFDIWFQSHQIFHICVVAAAFFHYCGMLKVAMNRRQYGCFYDTSSEIL